MPSPKAERAKSVTGKKNRTWIKEVIIANLLSHG